MKRRFVVGLTCALAAATIASGGAQSPQQQRPVFRSNTSFVSVDAYPRRDGKIVEGLTKADFEIFEDGKPQAVDDFEFIRVSPVTPDDERRDPTSIADGERQAADPHNRVFVVYLDIFNTTLFGSTYAREPIIEFLNRSVGPKDLFAVMTPELPVSGMTFARRTETLDAELRKYWNWAEGSDRKIIIPRSEDEGRLLVCGPEGEGLVRLHRKEMTLRSIEQMIARLGNLRDERKNILFVSEGWSLPEGRMGTSRNSRPSIPTIGVGPNGRLGVGANMSGMSDASWCDSQFAMLTSINFAMRFREMVNSAVRANVAFYPVDMAGLRVGGGLSGPVEMLHDLALSTDGRAVTNTNDLVSGVRRVADDLSAFYLLGYYSNNTDADGKFRRIEVKVRQPGVKVSARRGYTAPTAAMRKAEAEAAARPVRETTAVDLELGRLGRLRADARMYSSGIVTGTTIDVVAEIASGEFAGNRWANGATVSLRISPKGDDAKEITAQGKIEPGTRGTIVKVPVATPAAAWRVRMRIAGGDEVIDDEFEIVTPPVSAISEPTVFRAGASPRSPLRPVADFKFFRTERVHVEWILSKALDDRTARLLNRQGDAMAVPVSLTERADGDRQILAADLVLAPLADGDYVIEVTATVAGQKHQKLLAFRVVR